jgi:hypothetical protein
MALIIALSPPNKMMFFDVSSEPDKVKKALKNIVIFDNLITIIYHQQA